MAMLFSVASGWSLWTNSEIWNYGNTAYRIKVGDVRRDGHQRIYCGTRNGSVNELSFEQGSWVNRVLDVLPAEVYDVTIANGRNDTLSRLYLPVLNGHLYELSYEGGIWLRRDMGSGSGRMNQVAFGYGRNDTIQRGYATNTDGHVYEFTWEQGAWRQADLGNIGGWMIDVAVGITAHNNRWHVYSSSQNGGIYELTYDSGWSSSLVDQIGGAPWGMEIGTRSFLDTFDLPLYVTSETERDVWAYCWTVSGWQKTSIGHPGQSTLYGSDIALGDGRNDWVERVYQINKDAHTYEFSYEGGQWQTDDLGDGGYGWATGITVGRGRDDSLYHVYACFPDGRVTEYTYTTGVSEEPGFGPHFNQSRLEAFPNPFRDNLAIRLVPTPIRIAPLEIFDSRGVLVRRIESTKERTISHWDGRDKDGRFLPGGVYFVRMRGYDIPSVKVVKVR